MLDLESIMTLIIILLLVVPKIIDKTKIIDTHVKFMIILAIKLIVLVMLGIRLGIAIA